MAELRCPTCGTGLTPISSRRAGRAHALWCWKCERYLRLGEVKLAEQVARDEARAAR